ncbi:uncharacterized protein I303_102158 [Kwoniella dejecticola CBS 10117]|uniref:Uncharacterized protein n=1 Tax=Kwoniella dejecticola CBS 10117 TaxID=1296121 RepID=A0AAJ8KLF8_9TREE
MTTTAPTTEFPKMERRPSETPSVGSSTFSTIKEKMARALSPNRDAHSSNNVRLGSEGRRQSFGAGGGE